ncbi:MULTISPECIES: hypothetical protein [unclassified Streptomyces]|uniref:hypothetical protein n=1 Tax=unclassified Streptomyces TaxID=2593676 RepID=UPI002E79307B|nr:hypothetical protein [Streptomyces sp. JV184]MEE1743776.1 hypothetical protein [Streptomyces sp. JV184]
MPGHPGKRTLPVHAIEWSAGPANGGRADEDRALSHLGFWLNFCDATPLLLVLAPVQPADLLFLRVS